MTATPLLRERLAGEAVWPPPIWLMRQAGRYLPEYRAVRAQAGGFIDLCTNPALASRSHAAADPPLRLRRRILFSDILMLPWALGPGPALSPRAKARCCRRSATPRASTALRPRRGVPAAMAPDHRDGRRVARRPAAGRRR